MTGGFDHPDLGLRHEVSQATDGVDVDGSIIGGDHDQYGLAPASEEVAIVPSDPVAQPLAGGAPVGTQLVVEVYLRIVGIDPRAFNQEPLVEIRYHPIPPQTVDDPEDGAGGEGGNLSLERHPQRPRRIDRGVQHQPVDPLRKTRGVLEGDGRAQADAADIVILEAKAVGESVQELGVRGHREGRIAGRRLAAAGQVGDQYPPVIAEGRAPGVEVLERADEPVTQKQRLARSLVEVPDPPLPDVDELDVLRTDRGVYSPVSICARCSRPL